VKRLAIMLAVCGALGFATDALAAGVMIDDSALAPAERTALLGEVAAARKSDPNAFAAVAALRTQIADLDAQKRGRLATVTPALIALGKSGVPAMLSELAVSGGRGSLNDSAWLAWRLDLIEAVGAARDARATAVLEAILDSPERDFLLVRASAAALGKQNTTRAAKRLVALSRTSDTVKQVALLAGMGHCRRQIVVERLAEAMATATSSRAVKSATYIAHALGDAGSAWAWQTPGQVSAEEAGVRATAAAALIDAFVALDAAAVRKIVTQAVLVVNDGSTKALIAAARRGANTATVTALDELEQRFDANPIR
jgi:hypothetical protein